MPIGTAPRFWTWGWHRFEKLPYSCRDIMAISMCLAPNMFLRHRESVSETDQMTAAETSVLSQQKTCVLSLQSPRLLLAAAGCHGPKSCQKPHSFCVFELATLYSIREGQRSASPSTDFYNNFSPSSSAGSPPNPSLGLLKMRQSPSVQALFEEQSGAKHVPNVVHVFSNLSMTIVWGQHRLSYH